MKITHFANNCYEVKFCNGVSVVTDPWIDGPAYDGHWLNGLSGEQIERFFDWVNPDYVFISHVHPDHFHPETLIRWRRHKCKFLVHSEQRPISAWLREVMGESRLILLPEDQPCVVDEVTVTAFKRFKSPNPIDSVAVFQHPRAATIFCNDNALPWAALIDIARGIPSRSQVAVVYPVGKASLYPNRANLPPKEVRRIATEMRQTMMDDFKALTENLKDWTFIPCENHYEIAGDPKWEYIRLSRQQIRAVALDRVNVCATLLDPFSSLDVFRDDVVGSTLQQIVPPNHRVYLQTECRLWHTQLGTEVLSTKFTLPRAVLNRILVGKMTWNEAEIAGLIHMHRTPDQYHPELHAAMNGLRLV